MPRAENLMTAFKNVLQVCEFMGLGFWGASFTYDNKRIGRQNVRVKLDCAVADANRRPVSRGVNGIFSVSLFRSHPTLY